MSTPATAQRLTTRDLTTFTRCLSVALRQNCSAADTLAKLEADTRRGRLKTTVAELRRRMASGATFSEAVAGCPESFPPAYRAAVSAGETGGDLTGAMASLLDLYERTLAAKQRLAPSTIYTFAVLITGLVIVRRLLTEVVPEFAEIFEEFGKGLPAPTEFLVDLSRFHTEHGAASELLFSLELVLFVLLACWLRSETPGVRVFDWIKLRLPILGAGPYARAVARFSRTLAALLSTKVAPGDSLRLAADAAGNAALRDVAEMACERIENGDSIATALKETRFFKHRYWWLLDAAERAGAAGEALFALADIHEQELVRPRSFLGSSTNLLLLLFLGLFLGFVVVSLYLPIFTLGDAMM